MDLNKLKAYLQTLAASLEDEHKKILDARLRGLISVFPFNEYEYVLMFLLDKKTITFKEYEKLRNDYASFNKYINLYGISPRRFGGDLGRTTY